jgi:hypothetical protein
MTQEFNETSLTGNETMDVFYTKATFQSLCEYAECVLNGSLAPGMVIMKTKYLGEEGAAICEVVSRDEQGYPVDVKPVLVFLTNTMAEGLTTVDDCELTVAEEPEEPAGHGGQVH